MPRVTGPKFPGLGRGAYHTVMKSTRPLVALCLSSALLLSACSGSSDTDADQATATSDEVSSTTDAATSTVDPDQAASTADPAEGDSQGALSIGEAESIADEVLTAAAQSTQSDGSAAEADMEAAYAGPALEAAQAADKLEAVEGNPPAIDLIVNPIEASVLAISRDDGEEPAVILAQTVPGSGVPELYLLASQDGTEDFKIVWSAPMMEGTSVAAFDRRTAGTPVIRSGGGDFGSTPGDALNSLANYADYPVTGVQGLNSNNFAPQVRANAVAQAEAVEIQASFVESNAVMPDTALTLELEDGSGMTFGVLERTSTFTVKDGMELTPPDTFTTFVDDESITNEATLDAYVFVALTLPADDDHLQLIAAREQVVGASGE